MTSGNPDYLGTVRQIYGKAQSQSTATVVVASVVTSLLEIEGKGIIYGGSVHVKETTTQKNSIVRLLVDGTALDIASFNAMNEQSQDGEIDMPFSLRIFDEVNFRFCLRLVKGITFEESFEIDYLENHTKTPTVDCRTFYALM